MIHEPFPVLGLALSPLMIPNCLPSKGQWKSLKFPDGLVSGATCERAVHDDSLHDLPL
jgi:hypothetical protein